MKINPSEIDLIVFDLDGTLADSLPDLANAANFVCRRLGLPEHPQAAVQQMIGGGEINFVRRFLEPENQHHFDQAMALYWEYYARHLGDLTRLYPGVAETLKHFAHKKLAVLSNKHQKLTEKVLEVLGIRPFFAAVRGGGTDLALKPSPESLAALIQEMGVAPARTLMVGDKPADVLAGKGAGARTLGVTYGYGDAAALRAAAPEFLVSHLAELKNLFV